MQWLYSDPAQWLDSDSVFTAENCWQHVITELVNSVDTVLLTIINSDNTVTVQSLCSLCPKVTDKTEACCVLKPKQLSSLIFLIRWNNDTTTMTNASRALLALLWIHTLLNFFPCFIVIHARVWRASVRENFPKQNTKAPDIGHCGVCTCSRMLVEGLGSRIGKQARIMIMHCESKTCNWWSKKEEKAYIFVCFVCVCVCVFEDRKIGCAFITHFRKMNQL